MEKYGFVYIWFDRKHKRYYVGCHWGKTEDSYICSSNWMRDAYRRRPKDFKRRILKNNIINLKEMFVEEAKFLALIKSKELGKKYYNLHNVNKNHWTTNEQSKLTVGQKISASPMRKQRISESNKGRIVSEETKEKNRQANKKQFEDPTQIELRKQKSKELWSNPEYLEKHRKSRSKPGFYKGFNKSHSEETKRMISENKKGKSVHSPEYKSQVSKHFSNTIWVTNGLINRRINSLEAIPEGYRRGKSKV